jgi:hypothetical protein
LPADQELGTRKRSSQWPYILGCLFIFVTIFMPKGIIGLPGQFRELKTPAGPRARRWRPDRNLRTCNRVQKSARGRRRIDMKKTSNLQPPTSNLQWAGVVWAFAVGGWRLEVGGSRFSFQMSLAHTKDFILSLEGVHKTFEGFKAISELNFYLDEGELRVIIGPNWRGAKARCWISSRAASNRTKGRLNLAATKPT